MREERDAVEVGRLHFSVHPDEEVAFLVEPLEVFLGVIHAFGHFAVKGEDKVPDAKVGRAVVDGGLP